MCPITFWPYQISESHASLKQTLCSHVGISEHGRKIFMSISLCANLESNEFSCLLLRDKGKILLTAGTSPQNETERHNDIYCTFTTRNTV